MRRLASFNSGVMARLGVCSIWHSHCSSRLSRFVESLLWGDCCVDEDCTMVSLFSYAIGHSQNRSETVTCRSMDVNYRRFINDQVFHEDLCLLNDSESLILFINALMWRSNVCR